MCSGFLGGLFVVVNLAYHRQLCCSCLGCSLMFFVIVSVSCITWQVQLYVFKKILLEKTTASLSLVEIQVALLDKAQQPQEQCFPFVPVCAVFSYGQTMVWLPVFGIFNMHMHVDVCDCTWGAVQTP